MAKLAELLQQTGQPLGLRGQALAAFIQSGDSGSPVLFRQLLTEHEDRTFTIGCARFGGTPGCKIYRIAYRTY